MGAFQTIRQLLGASPPRDRRLFEGARRNLEQQQLRSMRRRRAAHLHSNLHRWAVRGYAAAKQEEIFAGFAGTPNSANGELYSDLRKLRQRARQEANNDPYVVRFLELFKTNVVGPQGLQLQADFRYEDGEPDEDDNDLVESAFAEWSRRGTCDVSGRLSWEDAQALAAESVARDGEVLIRLVKAPQENRFGFALQVLECDYLDEKHVEDLANGNRIVMGVELNRWGRTIAYHLRPRRAYFDPVSGARQMTEDVRVPAEDMLHVFPIRRPEQVRGVPLTHASLRRLHQLDGYEEAEVVAARIGASKMGFFTTPTGDEYVGDDEAEDGSKITEADPGTFQELPAGTDFKPWDPQHPTSAYADFMKAALRGAATGMGLTYSSLTGDLEAANYSSLRQGALTERDTWRFWQRWFSQAVCQPVYEAWLDHSVLTGALPVPARKRQKYMSVRWQPRGWQWVDPLKEIQAADLALRLGLTTFSEVLAAQGKDFQETVAQIQKERKILEAAGIKPLDAEKSKVSSPPEEEDSK